MASSGNVLETATSRTEEGSRPADRAAASMRARTSAKRPEIDIVRTVRIVRVVRIVHAFGSFGIKRTRTTRTICERTERFERAERFERLFPDHRLQGGKRRLDLGRLRSVRIELQVFFE